MCENLPAHPPLILFWVSSLAAIVVPLLGTAAKITPLSPKLSRLPLHPFHDGIAQIHFYHSNSLCFCFTLLASFPKIPSFHPIGLSSSHSDFINLYWLAAVYHSLLFTATPVCAGSAALMVKSKVSKAAATSRQTGGSNVQESDLHLYQEEYLQFLGQDTFLRNEETTDTDAPDVQATQPQEGEMESTGSAGDLISYECRIADQPPVTLEMRFASLNSHHRHLVGSSPCPTGGFSHQQPATDVEEKGSTAEGSDGTLPLEEAEKGIITLPEMDPGSMEVQMTPEAVDTPHVPTHMVMLCEALKARQAVLERSIQQDRERKNELLGNVITEVRSMSNVLSEGVRQFSASIVSLERHGQRFMEMREEKYILMRAQAAHNLGMTIDVVDDIIRKRRAQDFQRREDDE
ncbi:Hypothetical predicted protein [Pelobates cultripes]|uniref:Uncharacterized protein n=1 Tax=Pelobates cultripes TaxID=61616 RepID=A0AAD1TJD3_PELCU|nr:Hypothetical predicted protein [Pelobates cultripes]